MYTVAQHCTNNEAVFLLKYARSEEEDFISVINHKIIVELHVLVCTKCGKATCIMHTYKCTIIL